MPWKMFDSVFSRFPSTISFRWCGCGHLASNVSYLSSPGCLSIFWINYPASLNPGSRPCWLGTITNYWSSLAIPPALLFVGVTAIISQPEFDPWFSPLVPANIELGNATVQMKNCSSCKSSTFCPCWEMVRYSDNKIQFLCVYQRWKSFNILDNSKQLQLFYRFSWSPLFEMSLVAPSILWAPCPRCAKLKMQLNYNMKGKRKSGWPNTLARRPKLALAVVVPCWGKCEPSFVLKI